MPEFDLSTIKAPESQASGPQFDMSTIKPPVTLAEPKQPTFLKSDIDSYKQGWQALKDLNPASKTTYFQKTAQPAGDTLKEKYKAGTAGLKDYASAFLEGGMNSPAGQAMKISGAVPGMAEIGTANNKYAVPYIAKHTGQSPEEVQLEEMALPFVPKIGKALRAEKIETPAIKTVDGSIKKGGPTHDDIGVDGDRGFVTNKGKFVSREDGLKIAQKAKQVQGNPLVEGQLHSEDLMKGRSKQSITDKVADDLYKLSNKDEVRRINYVKNLKQLKNIPDATWQKLYAYKDDPKSTKLTPQEQAIYDKTIPKIAERSEQILKEFKKDGIDFGEIGRAPRFVKGKDSLADRLTGEKSKGFKGKNLSTYSPNAVGRQMFALVGKDGTRRIVKLEDSGKITEQGKPIGEVTKGLNTNLGKLEQATTAEIEKATPLEYHKNLLMNEYLRAQSLERAKDAKDFLENMKKDPEFLQNAAKEGGNSEIPDTWKEIPGIKAFQGWKFDPKIAEVFEDYIGNMKTPEDYSNAVMNIAKATKASIFFNPIRHMINATNMFATSKGLAGTVRDSLNTPKALGKAVKSVITQDKDFRKNAEAGLSQPSMRDTAQKFQKELIRSAGLAAQKDPAGFADLAKKWGYNSTVGMMKGLLGASNKLLWAYSDILVNTRVNEYMARGLSREEAIRRVEQVMPNYRIPSRVAGSRTVSKVLQNPVATMFGRYDYNRFKNLTGMISRSFKNDKSAWESRDQLLALAVMTTLGYSYLDKWIQKETGEDEAHMNLGGFSSMIDNAKDISEGKKTVGQGLQSTFAPGYLATPIEMLQGQNFYTGQPIWQRGDVNDLMQGDAGGAANLGFDTAKYLGDKFMPLQLLDTIASGKKELPEIGLNQLGVNIPSGAQDSAINKINRSANKRARKANKKRPDWFEDAVE